MMHDRRMPRWVVWGLAAAFALVEIAIWTIDGARPWRIGTIVEIGAAWAVILALVALAARRPHVASTPAQPSEPVPTATSEEIHQLQLQNTMLQTLARSVDVPLAFQTLATRIARIVPCDRMGLALLTEDGQEFQTFTARVQQQERRLRPRPELVFKVEGTALGSVARTREPLLLNDLQPSAAQFLDVTVLHTSGFQSGIVVPLVSKGRVVGTLNVVSRQKNAFTEAHVKALEPIAEILAVAHVAQQLQVALGKHQAAEAMMEMTLAISAEMHSALQTIIGHCDLLERGYPDPVLQRDLAMVVRQAQRLAGLLEKLRNSAQDRTRKLSTSVAQQEIPSSPEAYGDREVT